MPDDPVSGDRVSDEGVSDGRVPPDPFAPVQASPRFATPLAVLALLLAVGSLATGVAALVGPFGMAIGLVAHVKGSRLGMPAAVVNAIALVVGMTIVLYLR